MAEITRAQQLEALPWVEKYRPQALGDLIAHTEIIATIDRFVTEDRLPHLLLYGPPGTGKTSTILACARKMFGAQYQGMILELNASDDRGIDVVRQQIKDFASTRKIFSDGIKLVVLDEADAMTNAAQMALRRVIERYTRNTRFCLICNHVGRIIRALQSRCTRFRFAPLSEEQMGAKLDEVLTAEGVRAVPEGRAAILRLANGDMRRALNIAQSTGMAFDVIDEDAVYACTGEPHPREIKRMMGWMLADPFETAHANVADLRTSRGLALQDLVREIHQRVVTAAFPHEATVYLCRELADLEHRLCTGVTEPIQLASLVGIFQAARPLIVAGASAAVPSGEAEAMDTGEDG